MSEAMRPSGYDEQDEFFQMMQMFQVETASNMPRLDCLYDAAEELAMTMGDNETLTYLSLPATHGTLYLSASDLFQQGSIPDNSARIVFFDPPIMVGGLVKTGPLIVSYNVTESRVVKNSVEYPNAVDIHDKASMILQELQHQSELDSLTRELLLVVENVNKAEQLGRSWVEITPNISSIQSMNELVRLTIHSNNKHTTHDTSTYRTSFSEHDALSIVSTNTHCDDMTGRTIQKAPLPNIYVSYVNHEEKIEAVLVVYDEVGPVFSQGDTRKVKADKQLSLVEENEVWYSLAQAGINTPNKEQIAFLQSKVDAALEAKSPHIRP